MKTKKKLLSLMSVALAAAVFTSCTDTVIEGPDKPETPAEIKLNGNVLASEAQTYAPVNGTVANFTAKVLLSKVSGSYTSPDLLHDGTMAFASGNAIGFTAPNQQYYPTDGSNVYLTGFYPATTWTASGNTFAYTFDGSADVMSSTQITTNKTHAVGPNYQTMTFNHLLTRLDFTLKAENASAITAWGNVTGIDVISALAATPMATVTVTATSPSTVDFSNPLTPFPIYLDTDNLRFTGKAIPLTTTAEPTAYTMLSPITATGTADYKLKIYTTNFAAGIEVPVDLTSGDTTGKKYVITLTFKSTEIMAKAVVTDWIDGGGDNIIVQ